MSVGKIGSQCPKRVGNRRGKPPKRNVIVEGSAVPVHSKADQTGGIHIYP